MFQFQQSTGKLLKDGVELGLGYSGFGAGKDNPDMERLHNVGPIPKGKWTICRAQDRPEDLGPVVMPLLPLTATENFGRSGFWIHGDSNAHPGLASHGCIILSRPLRETIANSGDTLIEVIR